MVGGAPGADARLMIGGLCRRQGARPSRSGSYGAGSATQSEAMQRRPGDPIHSWVRLLAATHEGRERAERGERGGDLAGLGHRRTDRIDEGRA
jgi:hypothetical protein